MSSQPYLGDENKDKFQEIKENDLSLLKETAEK